ncbi:hypothetical protein M9H77_12383 [Catharanthus roseus]|uniref:Uncharacterized protein n=1 Tax=Catharanthus roseus TaxID=4058 RepID=A0ACC0BH69_CATRO|nr:hypothetical protein M9H77_12383 [Catharanthus roseus]
MKNPYSLLSRVMQSKYYPCGDFSSVPLGRRRSYVWKSILVARPHLLLGMRWRIGNGHKGNRNRMSSGRILIHMRQKQYSRCHCVRGGPWMSKYGQRSSRYAWLCQVATHSLAAKAALTYPSKVWMEVLPYCISFAVQGYLI